MGERERTRTVQRNTGRAPDGVTVTVIDGPSKRAPVSGALVVIGRSVDADVVLDDPTVSEFHLEVRPHPGGAIIRDLGSHNGSFLGEVRIEKAILPTTQDLTIGRSLVRVASTCGMTAPPPERESFSALRGVSPASRALFGLLARVAPTDLSVLLEGATGTGKELAARGIHEESRRSDRPFQVLDCTAIPHALAESVLFGHERGAFTGAEQSRPGVFEATTGGTVFLDEIGELPLEVQPKLLRVLEERRVTRVGGRQSIAVDFRVVSASWRNLRRLINEGRFRDDLYHRLAQVRVEIPSLADRREDLDDLVLHFLRSIPTDAIGARSISREAMAALKQREFPGNVRELRNVVERAARMAEGSVIAPSDLVFDRILERGREASVADDDDASIEAFKVAKQTAIDDFEFGYLLRLRDRSGGSLRRASLVAGVQRHYLRGRFRKHGIRVNDREE